MIEKSKLKCECQYLLHFLAFYKSVNPHDINDNKTNGYYEFILKEDTMATIQKPTRPSADSPRNSDNRTTPLRTRLLQVDNASCSSTTISTTNNEIEEPTPTNSTIFNHPGRWKVFIGHTRRSGDATTLANETYHEYHTLGLPPWLDVKMTDTSTAAMEEGVKNSTCFIAIVTGPCVNPDCPTDKPADNAYFSREYCRMELRWAKQSNKPIVCLVRAEDKSKVDELFSFAPDDLKYLIDHVIYFDRNDRDYQKIGVRKMLIASGLRSEGFGKVVINKNETLPNHEAGVHLITVFEATDARGKILATALTNALLERGYKVNGNDTTRDDVVECKTKEEPSNTTINNNNNFISKTDALLVILTENTFSNTVSNTIRAALEINIPVVCVVHAQDKTKIGTFLQNVPNDLKHLGAHSIFHIDMNDSDYFQCGVTKILQASGHLKSNADDDVQNVDVRLDPFAQRIQQRVLLLGQHFVGRDWLATAVEDEINKVNGLKTTNEKNENAVSCNTTSSQTVVVVYGDSGTGKSAFFSRILDSNFCRDKFCI